MKAINVKFQTINDFIKLNKLEKAYKVICSLDEQLNESLSIISESVINKEIDEDLNRHISILYNLGGFLIDIGSLQPDLNIIQKGIKLIDKVMCVNNIEMYKYYPQLLYNLANGLSSKLKLTQGTKKHLFLSDIELTERTKSIYRKAIELNHTHTELLINYANFLEAQYSRSLESLDYYNMALELHPDKAMALCNKAETLLYLYQFLGGDATKSIIIDAYFLLKKAINIGLELAPKKYFSSLSDMLIKKYPQLLDISKNTCTGDIPNHAGTFDEYYVKFCHENELFLNPLGKEHKCAAALYDPLTISKMIVNMDDKDKYLRYSGYLNRLKQEFVTARYFAALSFYKNNEAHFLDNGVNIIDTLDYKAYSIYLEFARSSFRVAYGILDKSAIIVNEYYQIGFNPNRLYFNYLSLLKNGSASSNNSEKLKKLHPIKNPFLAAIIDIANDFDNKYFFGLKDIRNELEHRFYEIYQISKHDQITPELFRQKLLELLHIAKNCIFYIVMMIDWEERTAEAQINHDNIITLQGYLVPDQWKIE